jgi:hypothetical protein
MANKTTLQQQLPVKDNISLILLLSAAITLIMTVFSGLGFLFPDVFYPDPGLLEQYLANDLVNIILGLPLFIAALALFKKGKLLGALLLPGALIYVIYNYLAYLLGRGWSWISYINLLLVVLSIICLILHLRSINHQDVMGKLEGRVGEKVSGWILVVFGLAFIGLAVSTIVAGIQEGTIPPLGENAVSVADILVSLGWVGGGILLLGKKPLGYTTALGLLVSASFLFIGLILFFFLAPLVSDRPFDWIEVITVLAMGLICFIPTGLFWRGIARSSSLSPAKE